MKRGSRERPVFLRMLVGILLTYALIISFGDSPIGDPIRIVLLGLLLWLGMRQGRPRSFRPLTIGLTLLLLVVVVVAKHVGSARVASGVVGAATLILITALVVTIVANVVHIGEIDTATVFGVLCIYLLLALFFAAVNQVVGAFSTHYLNGTTEPAPASDLLYFSVITLATVGYGDITPAGQVARAVSVVEALTGQLYLVSVVAAVVGGWRRRAPGQGPENGE